MIIYSMKLPDPIRDYATQMRHQWLHDKGDFIVLTVSGIYTAVVIGLSAWEVVA